MSFLNLVSFVVKSLASWDADTRRIFELFTHVIPNIIIYLILGYFYAIGFFINWNVNPPI